jgi:hypothetical protein
MIHIHAQMVTTLHNPDGFALDIACKLIFFASAIAARRWLSVLPALFLLFRVHKPAPPFLHSVFDHFSI